MYKSASEIEGNAEEVETMRSEVIGHQVRRPKKVSVADDLHSCLNIAQDNILTLEHFPLSASLLRTNNNATKQGRKLEEGGRACTQGRD